MARLQDNNLWRLVDFDTKPIPEAPKILQGLASMGHCRSWAFLKKFLWKQKGTFKPLDQRRARLTWNMHHISHQQPVWMTLDPVRTWVL